MSQKQAIGPLDLRKKCTRCKACARKKIKCPGGNPCATCIRAGLACRRQGDETQNAVFVFYAMPGQVPTTVRTIQLEHFFEFLKSNHTIFRVDNLAEVLLPLVNTSSLLDSIACALGALNASRRGSRAAYSRAECPKSRAYYLYSESIASMKLALSNPGICHQDDTLWATFFLGLFELMADPSGESWAKHLLYGTSQILKATSSTAVVSPSRRAFLKAFQVFEAARAVTFGGATALDWTAHQGHVSDATSPEDWNDIGKVTETIFRISNLQSRFHYYVFCNPSSTDLNTGFDPNLEEFGREGFLIQNDLYRLHDRLVAMRQLKHGDLELDQSIIWCNSLFIFLFYTFDYHNCWHLKDCPRLSKAELSSQVDQIIQRSEIVFNTPGSSSLLLAIPLRLAGTHAREQSQRISIIAMMDRIIKCGFLAPIRMKMDLLQIWEHGVKLWL